MYHRITVESVRGRPVVHECRRREEAQGLLERVKLERDSWHIVYETRESESANLVIQLSLYRSDLYGWHAVRGSAQALWSEPTPSAASSRGAGGSA